jgi:hypothetical protein
MSGNLLHVGATVFCQHAGTAQALVPSTRVMVSGQPVVTQTSPFAVAGCALSSSPGPFCAMAQFTSGATRVMSDGMPVLLSTSQAVCAATGQGVQIAVSQTRVTAT